MTVDFWTWRMASSFTSEDTSFYQMNGSRNKNLGDLLLALQQRVQLIAALEAILLRLLRLLLVVEVLSRLRNLLVNVLLRSLRRRNDGRFLDLANGVFIHFRRHFLLVIIRFLIQHTLATFCFRFNNASKSEARWNSYFFVSSCCCS